MRRNGIADQTPQAPTYTIDNLDGASLYCGDELLLGRVEASARLHTFGCTHGRPLQSTTVPLSPLLTAPIVVIVGFVLWGGVDCK